ncbi:MAG: RIP metalloprotease RseP [Campylobacter sp.]
MKSLILTILVLIVGFYYYSASFAVTILAISFLIFFHELGHFLAARSIGVSVTTFSVGFGKTIISKKIGETEYRLSAVPLGGYVSLKGQEDLDPTARSDDADSYNSCSPLGRIWILFAGPFFNIILAFLIYITLGFIGVERLAPVVGKIAPDSAAQKFGIKTGDKILAIDGVEIREWDDIAKNIALKELDIEILRKNTDEAAQISTPNLDNHSAINSAQNNSNSTSNYSTIHIKLTPKIGEKENIWREKIQTPLIGISPTGDFITLYHTGASSLNFALSETYKASSLIIVGLEKLLSGAVAIKEMGGIVAMTDITTRAVGVSVSVLLYVVALLSVNLGILNLLPVPVLDGGHIAFNLYELIFRRPVSQKLFEKASYVGMALLFALMIFTIINDFLRMFGVYK